MRKPLSLLPVVVLALVGCSNNADSVKTPSTNDSVISDSAPRDIAESTDVAMTFVSLKVPNMV